MASQIGYVYSANRTAPIPFSTIIHTSFGPTASPRIWEKMANRAWDRWNRCHWWEQGVEELGKVLKREVTANNGERTGDNGGNEGEDGSGPSDLTKTLTGPNLPPTIDPARHKMVYLSADSEEELATLSENEVYVIGGIVDRNRYKVGYSLHARLAMWLMR